MLASASLARHARERGLVPVRVRPDIVFLGRDRRFSHARLALAANAIRAGAELVVANPDLVHPGPGGAVVPETGALLAALLACTGPVSYRLIGKPEPTLFATGLALLDLPKRAVAMLGDNPRTDGEGARRFGLRYVEIADGVFPQAHGETACPRQKGVIALPA
ncbi:HAD hydrolase-like protein [Bosea sp. F3-2]|uniref:HAD hydrolase-like protein n=1 Tax=Bosea sp. F3-2 TaxID=2599640 RepID=UPI0020BEA77C|nr:HAD hydrolase-like protein [Bosea sp. F3-2]